MTTKPLDLAQFEGHTPGPWEIEVDNRDGRSRGYIRKAEWAPGQYAIARAMHRNQQYHENAFLLAAAPALLAECKRQREETTRLRLIVERLTHAANAYPQLVEEVRGLRDYCRPPGRGGRGEDDKTHYGASADLADIIFLPPRG